MEISRIRLRGWASTLKSTMPIAPFDHIGMNVIGGPTFADAILDRPSVHNAYRVRNSTARACGKPKLGTGGRKAPNPDIPKPSGLAAAKQGVAGYPGLGGRMSLVMTGRDKSRNTAVHQYGREAKRPSNQVYGPTQLCGEKKLTIKTCRRTSRPVFRPRFGRSMLSLLYYQKLTCPVKFSKAVPELPKVVTIKCHEPPVSHT